MTDSPNTTTGRHTPLRFRFHVAMAGALGLGGDLTSWSEAELAETAELVAVYKAIRPLVQRGLHHRVAPAGGPVTAVHYAAPDDSEHVLLTWRPSTRFGHRPPRTAARPRPRGPLPGRGGGPDPQRRRPRTPRHRPPAARRRPRQQPDPAPPRRP
ncbi:alpha-galactosidase [Streptomyces diastatochromogenes]|nr:alpha-galactosidase [Streptomyces diastatochromogenes]